MLGRQLRDFAEAVGTSRPGGTFSLFLDQVPDVLEVIARYVARLLVLDEGVERLAIIGPLHRSVVSLDDGQIADRLGISSRFHGRPIFGTFTVAVGFSRTVLVVSVEGHAVGICQHLAGCGRLSLQRAIVLLRCEHRAGEQDLSYGNRGDNAAIHRILPWLDGAASMAYPEHKTVDRRSHRLMLSP